MLVVSFSVGLLWEPHPSGLRQNLGLTGLVVAAVAVGGLVFARHTGPALTPLRKIEDPATREAVRQAVLDGGTDDPEVDRLARDLIDSTRRLRWIPPVLAVFAVLRALSLFLGDRSGWRLASDVSAIVLLLVLAGAVQVRNRRLAAYRGLDHHTP